MDYDVCEWHSDLSMDEREDSGIVRMAKADRVNYPSHQGMWKRSEEEHRGRSLKMAFPCSLLGRSSKRWFMDVVREHMQMVGVAEEDAEDRKSWKRMMHCGGQ